MILEATIPTIPVVVGTALIDSINPCAIGVLVLLLATLVSVSKDRKKMLTIGLVYISFVFLTYLAAGYGLLVFVQKMKLSSMLTWIVGGIVMIMGLIEIKDFFWYGKGISLAIPKNQAKNIMHYIDNVSIPGSIVLGMFVAAVELPCTGGPYLAITTMLAKLGFSLKVFWLLVVYNFIFVLPLLVILFMVYFGVDAKTVKDWKTKHRKWMRLVTGLSLLLLGVLLILWNNAILNFRL